MTNTTPAAPEKPPRPRWFQFSLRTLLVLMLILPISLGWLAQARMKSQRQWNAVYQLRQLGAEVLSAPGSDLNVSSISVPQRAPAWQRLIGIDLPVHLNHCFCQSDTFSDEDALPLKELPHLQSLSLLRSQLTDETSATIGRLKELKILNYGSSHLTDKSLSQLAKCPQLEALVFINVPVTDQGLSALENHPALRLLVCHSPLITDAGIASVATCQNLEELTVSSELLTAIHRCRPATPLRPAQAAQTVPFQGIVYRQGPGFACRFKESTSIKPR